MADFSFEVTGGKFAGTYHIDFADLDALDSRSFRSEVGIPLSQATFDLDVVAGLVWVTRRKQQRNLRFDEVAAEITYGTMQPVDDGAGASDPDEVDSPN